MLMGLKGCLETVDSDRRIAEMELQLRTGQQGDAVQ
jgi:hypothetical protein